MKKMNCNILLSVAFALGIFLGGIANAAVYPLPPVGDDMVGKAVTVIADGNEDLQTIGRQYDLGYFEMVEANRDLKPDVVLKRGTKVVLPSEFILPKYRTGIVINVAEMRLFYFPENGTHVFTYPIGVGRMGWVTPVGKTKIVKKEEKPTWTVPKSIQKAAADEGRIIPDVVPPGPDNPLGEFAMRLAFSEPYLIHGTNDPKGVGRRSSAGCVRMLPADIKDLFQRVPVGTSVVITNDPYKVGWKNNELFLEVHEPMQEDSLTYVQQPSLTRMVQAVLDAERGENDRIDWTLAENAAMDRQGVPVLIGKHQ